MPPHHSNSYQNGRKMPTNDKELRGSGDGRIFISVPMSKEMKTRIVKAALYNDKSTAQYMRKAISEYMKKNREWSIPGPTRRKY